MHFFFHWKCSIRIQFDCDLFAKEHLNVNIFEPLWIFQYLFFLSTYNSAKFQTCVICDDSSCWIFVFFFEFLFIYKRMKMEKSSKKKKNHEKCFLRIGKKTIISILWSKICRSIYSNVNPFPKFPTITIEKVYLKTNQHKITHWNADKEKHPTSYEPVIIRNKMVWLSIRPELSDLWICMIVIWIRAFKFPNAWRNSNFKSLNFLPKHMNLVNHVCTQKPDFEMFIGNCRAQFNCLPCKMIDSYF